MPLISSKKRRLGNSTIVILIFGAFLFLAAASSLCIYHAFKPSVEASVNEKFIAIDSRITTSYATAGYVLNATDFAVRALSAAGMSNEKISAFLRQVSAGLNQLHGYWFSIGFGEIYGSLDDEPLNLSASAPDSLSPENTAGAMPWFQTAKISGGRVVFTTPYLQPDGTIYLSAVKSLLEPNGTDTRGVLAIDLKFSGQSRDGWHDDDTSNPNDILLSQRLTIISHPDPRLLNMQIRSLGTDYHRIANMLIADEPVSNMHITDNNGKSAVASFRKISNGWYAGLIVPYYRFYRDFYVAVAFLLAASVIFASWLSVFVLKITRALLVTKNEKFAKESFVSRVSHEIHTPLATVMGMADLIAKKYSGEETYNYIDTLQSAAEQLQIMFDNLLDFSELESGSFNLLSADYELGHLLRAAVARAQKKMRSGSVELRIDIDADCPNDYRGDASRIAQILNALLDNAIKNTRAGTVTLTVKSVVAPVSDADDAREKPLKLSVAVSDTNDEASEFAEVVNELNASDEKLANMPTPSLLVADRFDLSLYLVKRLCEMLGGKLTVETKPQVGNVFIAEFTQVVISRRLLGEIRIAPTLLNQDKDAAPTFTAPDARMLVVDDIETNLIIAESFLAAYKIQVDTAGNGYDAVEKLRGGAYDLVLVDHMMPELDGIETVKMMRALDNHKFKDLPICAFSANYIAKTVELFLASGFNDFIRKPLDHSELNRLILKWLPAGKIKRAVADSR